MTVIWIPGQQVFFAMLEERVGDKQSVLIRKVQQSLGTFTSRTNPKAVKKMAVCGVAMSSPTIPSPVNNQQIATRRVQQATRPTASRPPKPNAKLVNLNCPQPRNANAQPPRPAHDVSGCPEHQLASLDIFVPTAAPGRHHPMSVCLTPPRRDRDPEPPLLSSSIALTSAATAPARTVLYAVLKHRQTQTSPLPAPAMWTRSIPVLIAIAPSLHASAWSVTCESIAQRLANQCLEHPHTLAASTSTLHTPPAHPLTAEAF
ncbi:hypothetical protein SprV_0200884500 [Sparganum proliferum]